MLEISSKIQNKLKPSTCQVSSKRNINKVVLGLPRVKKSILKELLYFKAKYEKAFPSQKLIAQKVGCSREYVNRTINEFVSSGIILKINLPWRSCLYELHPYLYSKEFRKRADLLIQTVRKVPQKKITPISPSSYSIFLNNEKLATTDQLAHSKLTFECYITKSISRARAHDSHFSKLKKEKMTIVEQITKTFGLENYEVSQLDEFDDVLLRNAFEKVATRELTGNKFRYFLAVCKSDKLKKPTSNFKKSNSTSVATITEWPKPDKLKRLRKDLEKAYYLKSLRDPNEKDSPIDKHITFLIGHIDLVEKHSKTHSNESILNDLIGERSNTREIEKDPTVVKFDRVDNIHSYSNFEEVLD